MEIMEIWKEDNFPNAVKVPVRGLHFYSWEAWLVDYVWWGRETQWI